MTFGIRNTDDGYVVEAYTQEYWKPILNFGNRQGDARVFYECICPKMSFTNICNMIKNYNKDRRLSLKRLERLCG